MATIQERLDEAKAAYHALLTGQAVVEVRDQSGDMIRYSQANRTALKAYIAELENQTGAKSVAPPMGFLS